MNIRDVFTLFVKLAPFVGLKHMCNIDNEPVYTKYTSDYENEDFDLKLPHLRNVHTLVYGQSFIKQIVDNILIVNYNDFVRIEDISLLEGDMCKQCHGNNSLQLSESPQKMHLGQAVYYMADFDTSYYYARIFHFGMNSTLTVIINSGTFQNPECHIDHNLDRLKRQMGISKFNFIFHNTPHPICFFCSVQRRFMKKPFSKCVDLTKPDKNHTHHLSKHGQKMIPLENKWSCSNRHRCFGDEISSHISRDNPYQHMCNPGLPTVYANEMIRHLSRHKLGS